MGSLLLFHASMRGWLISTTTTWDAQQQAAALSQSPVAWGNPGSRAARRPQRLVTHLDVGALQGDHLGEHTRRGADSGAGVRGRPRGTQGPRATDKPLLPGGAPHGNTARAAPDEPSHQVCARLRRRRREGKGGAGPRGAGGAQRSPPCRGGRRTHRHGRPAHVAGADAADLLDLHDVHFETRVWQCEGLEGARYDVSSGRHARRLVSFTGHRLSCVEKGDEQPAGQHLAGPAASSCRCADPQHLLASCRFRRRRPS